jgi:putative ABC transport system permease protein
MRLLYKLPLRLRSLFKRGRVEQELSDELRFHLEKLTEENVAKGMTPEDARYAALCELGGAEQIKEECRDMRRVNWIENFIQDLRYGVRMLARDRRFTAVVVLTLALGTGANTAIFSVVNTVLLRPLPYKDADRLVMVWGYNRARGFTTDQVSPLDFADWRAQNHHFESTAASADVVYTLTGVGEPALLIAYSFSADYFHVLGVPPLLGRTFLPEEEQPGRNNVAVLSYSLWQTRFGGRQDLVGKSISLDGAPYTVVGIMPPSFQYPPFTQLWTPLTVVKEAANDRAYRYLRVIARLKPGVTIQQAQAEMNTIARRLALEYPKTNKEEDATNIIGLRQMLSGDIRPALLVLTCAVGFLLLIACANVANLLLARAVGRQKEVAVRAALGASRSRLLRQLLTESVLLGLASGALGLLFAFWCVGALLPMFPPTLFNISIPHLDKIPIDGWVLGFALAVSLLTGVIFGLFPALRAGRVNTSESLKESSRSLTGGAQARRFRNALVVAEVALSVMLLTAAGLTLKSLLHLLGSSLGFSPENVLTLRVLLPSSRYRTDAQKLAFSNQALERIRSLPGVKSAGTVTFLPLSGWWGVRQVSAVGQSAPQTQPPSAVWSSVSPDYFQALSIPLLRGRLFMDQDAQGTRAVAIISKSLAGQLAPNADPVGKQIDVEGLKGAVEVVGVVGDVHQLGITSEIISEVYLPYSQAPAPIICFAIRTASDPTYLAKAAERAIWTVDKDQSIGYVMPMEELASQSLAPQRVVTLLLSGFAAMALLLAALGIYAVIAYSVTQRTHEIGIRMALGARATHILSLVVGRGLGLALAGATLGLAGSFGLMRFLSSLLYGVRPSDPLVFVTVSALLAAVALLACYIPARRATKVDPMVALRYE